MILLQEHQEMWVIQLLFKKSLSDWKEPQMVPIGYVADLLIIVYHLIGEGGYWVLLGLWCQPWESLETLKQNW
jgi:hypothetical protein